MQLSVVIVSYNVKYYLRQCLQSVQRSMQQLEVEVWVVDNCSTDQSLEYLQPLFPWVHFIANTTNAGFACANNLAIRQATGRYVLLLNPDTIVTETLLTNCVHFMDTHPDAGGAGVHMLRVDGSFALESRRGVPTPFVAFCKMSGLGRLFPYSRCFGRYYMRYLDEHEVNQVDILSGACMLLRREALDKVGLLDETFFMYGEDIDLSYRLLKAGYQNYYLPCSMLHYKGESTEKSSYRYVYTFYQAMQIFFKKHYAHYSLLFTLPISLTIWGRSLLAYAGNRLKHRSHSLAQATVPQNFLVLGCPEAVAQLRSLLAAWQPKGKHTFLCATQQEMPEGHLDCPLPMEPYQYVAYDTDAYSYESILALLARTPGNPVKLATYSIETGALITESAVYHLPPS